MNSSLTTWIRRATVLSLIAAAAFLVPAATARRTPERAGVTAVRVSDGGIQPQVAVGTDGTVHLVYFTGDAAAGDLWYRLIDRSGTMSPRIAVNTPGSAIAVGTVRGAHIAVGRDGRLFVGWMGSNKATARAPDGSAPMLVARMNDARTAFEPERNVVQHAFGLDGGGTIAADAAGNVWVAWHAGGPGVKDEAGRRVWVARSTDDGRTFAREVAASPAETGACGCCGMAALATAGNAVYMMYRSAAAIDRRHTYVLRSTDRGATYAATKLEEWNIGQCPMSTYSLVQAPSGVFATWETAGQVQFARVDVAAGTSPAIVRPSGEGRNRKHPALAVNARGEILLAWTEGMGWQRAGSIAWQVFSATGAPTNERGSARGAPVWDLVAAYAKPDGGFVVLY